MHYYRRNNFIIEIHKSNLHAGCNERHKKNVTEREINISEMQVQ